MATLGYRYEHILADYVGRDYTQETYIKHACCGGVDGAKPKLLSSFGVVKSLDFQRHYTYETVWVTSVQLFRITLYNNCKYHVI